MAQQAANGQRQLVFITGEAGIGKTSLINALRQILNSRSPQARFACGHCVESLSEKEPYYAVLEALSHCTSTDQESCLAAGPAGLRTLHDRPGELCEALEELARERLFILVLEDIQWAHQSTLELLSALARRSTSAKLLVIATYRPQHHSTTFYLKSIKQDLVVRHLCTELALEPLYQSNPSEFPQPAAGSGETARESSMTSSTSAPAAIRFLQTRFSIT